MLPQILLNRSTQLLRLQITCKTDTSLEKKMLFFFSSSNSKIYVAKVPTLAALKEVLVALANMIMVSQRLSENLD
jgi:hypothetical protein